MSKAREIKNTLLPVNMKSSFYASIDAYQTNIDTIVFESHLCDLEMKDAKEEEKKDIKKAFLSRTKDNRKARDNAVSIICNDAKSEDKRNLFSAVYAAYVDYKHCMNDDTFNKYVLAIHNLFCVRLYNTKPSKSIVRDITLRIDKQIGLKPQTINKMKKEHVAFMDVFNEKEYAKALVWCLSELIKTGNCNTIMPEEIAA